MQIIKMVKLTGIATEVGSLIQALTTGLIFSDGI